MSQNSLEAGYRKLIYAKTGNRCYYCGWELSLKNRTVDHVHPVSKKGNSDFENLVPCCSDCNKRKGFKTLEEFREAFMGKPKFTEEQITYLTAVGVWGTVEAYSKRVVAQSKFYFEEQNAN